MCAEKIPLVAKGAERRVKRAQTRERGPPSALAVFSIQNGRYKNIPINSYKSSINFRSKLGSTRAVRVSLWILWKIIHKQAFLLQPFRNSQRKNNLHCMPKNVFYNIKFGTSHEKCPFHVKNVGLTHVSSELMTFNLNICRWTWIWRFCQQKLL